MPFATWTIDDGRGGTVSAVVARPEGCAPGACTAVVLAHGAGNDMRNPLLSAVHEGLTARGFLTVKFNFPYAERRARVPDPAPVLEGCYRRVVEAIRSDPALRPRAIVLGGKSMGGRMASHLAAAGVECAGLLFLGYPLHPAGKPHRLRTAHLAEIRAPMLFLAGTRDALCRLDLLRHALAALRAPVTLHIIEGGDHSFAVPKALKRTPAAVTAEIVGVCADWLQSLRSEE
jgi:hypothetical protein